LDLLDAYPRRVFRRRRLGAVAIFLWAASFALAAQEPPSGNPLEPLERMFREGDPGRIRQVAGKGEKILMDSETLGFPHGYYSVDQVCLVLQTIFRSRSTLQFNFLKGGDPPEQPSRIIAVGRWRFRTGRSREQTAQIAFTLVQRDGGWILKELRDVP
jgi:hypothetical protein